MEDPITLRRRKLAKIRHKMGSQSPEEPFSLSLPLSTGESIADFVVSIAINIHKKRTSKTL
jgi:hypothetical protein